LTTTKNQNEAVDSNYHRDFTSFGSKGATTSSTSKRSSNDVEKRQCDSNKSKNAKLSSGMYTPVQL